MMASRVSRLGAVTFDYTLSGNTLTIDGVIDGTSITATFEKVS